MADMSISGSSSNLIYSTDKTTTDIITNLTNNTVAQNTGVIGVATNSVGSVVSDSDAKGVAKALTAVSAASPGPEKLPDNANEIALKRFKNSFAELCRINQEQMAEAFNLIR